MNKVATIQMCSTSSVDENLANAALLIEKASDSLRIKEQPGSGKIQDFLSALAIKHNIWIVGGTIPIACDVPNKIRAACIVFDNLGHQVARYDKIHLFDVTLSEHEVYKESDTTQPGDEAVVIDTPVGKLGLCVCYDIRFPDHIAKLSAQGAEIIAVPAAFTVKTGAAHWELLARCRAIDSFSYVIGACQGGTHPGGRKTHGHTMIVDPWGVIVEEIHTPGNGVVCVEIYLEKLYEIRNQIPVITVNRTAGNNLVL
jgi:predicted amidohydrolase